MATSVPEAVVGQAAHPLRSPAGGNPAPPCARAPPESPQPPPWRARPPLPAAAPRPPHAASARTATTTAFRVVFGRQGFSRFRIPAAPLIDDRLQHATCKCAPCSQWMCAMHVATGPAQIIDTVWRMQGFQGPEEAAGDAWLAHPAAALAPSAALSCAFSWAACAATSSCGSRSTAT